jgi:EmrB/QacA subfamily drug resistance transporter
MAEAANLTQDRTAAAAPGLNPRRWAALVVALVAVFMDILDTTVVIVALPSIQRALDLGASTLQWTVAAYTLAFALLLIAGGRLGDIYGRKRVFLVGLAGFTVASVLTGTAQSAAMLVGSRALQGAMAALMVPQVLSFIQVEFPVAERARAFAVYGMTFALGGVSGPLLGGLLTEADLFGLGWRAIFLVNLPVGILAFAGAGALLRESRAPRPPRLDPVGTLLVTAGLLALLYPLVQGHDLGWPVWTYVLMAASVPILVLFAAYERHKTRKDGSPLVELGLFRYRGVVGGLLIALLFFAGAGYSFVLTLHLQEGLGFSPLGAAMAFLPFSVGVVAGSGAAMRLVPRLGRRLVTGGGLVMALGVALLVAAVQRYGEALHGWQLTPGMLVAGVGMAMVSTTLVTIVLARVPGRDAGSASGVVNTTLQIGLAAGIAAVGTLFFTLLDDGVGFVDATRRSLWLEIGLFLTSALLSFLLPPGPVSALGPGEGKEVPHATAERRQAMADGTPR